MKTAFRTPRPANYRRGVTLIEMLVAVALLVLMMTIIVQVFAAATGAVSTQRVYQELDTSLRQVDTMLRQDLAGVTARFTPPLDPQKNLGYFEYIENSFADNQGEDADDCLKFTAKAPEGQVFTGRMFLQNAMNAPLGGLSAAQQSVYYNSQPVTITSQYAEIIYFLRNGNLYRRVLLVAPERQSSVYQGTTGTGSFRYSPFNPYPSATSLSTSWQGMNDISAHPAAPLTDPLKSVTALEVIILNTLGDLTNRENRFASPRFVNDFVQVSDTTATAVNSSDGVPDDQNGDTVPDFWPSLYPNAIAAGLLNEVVPTTVTMRPYGSALNMAFPYIYPYAYSHPDAETLNLGWIHSPNPYYTSAVAGSWLAVLNHLNHNPLLGGDSLPRPYHPTNSSLIETYWGFPTWRETMHVAWTDPYRTIASAGIGPSFGLVPLSASSQPADTLNFLPPMTNAYIPNTNTQIRLTPQLYNDGYGSNSSFIAYTGLPPAQQDALWKQLFEDDLIMTGVRSFDVKALDNAYGSYADLGWGDDLRLYTPYIPVKPTDVPPYLGQGISGGTAINQLLVWPPNASNTSTTSNTFDLYSQTFAHEGRIPPLTWDNKLDAQTFSQNVGENNASTVRLRRVWDSWSTDYSKAPATGVNPNTGQPYGAVLGQQAIYPSYPPPYPMPLRGIQIQIRVSDPRGERVKVLTVRQDFSDKL